KSLIKERQITSWQSYSSENPSALCLLLTDTISEWIGIAHGFKNIGIPFTITTSVEQAVKHPVVFVYPLVSGKVLSHDEIQALAAVPRKGGVLIATNVYGGGLNEVFAFDTLLASVNRSSMILNTPAFPL